MRALELAFCVMAVVVIVVGVIVEIVDWCRLMNSSQVSDKIKTHQ